MCCKYIALGMDTHNVYKTKRRWSSSDYIYAVQTRIHTHTQTDPHAHTRKCTQAGEKCAPCLVGERLLTRDVHGTYTGQWLWQRVTGVGANMQTRPRGCGVLGGRPARTWLMSPQMQDTPRQSRIDLGVGHGRQRIVYTGGLRGHRQERGNTQGHPRRDSVLVQPEGHP